MPVANIPTKIILFSIRVDEATRYANTDADKNATGNQRLYEKHSSDTPPTSTLTIRSRTTSPLYDAAILLEFCPRKPTSLFSSWLSFIVVVLRTENNWNFGRIISHACTPSHVILRPDFSADFLRRKSSLFAGSLASVSFLKMSEIRE